MNPPADPNTPAPPPPPGPQYEFTAEQNQVIDELADAMSWVRIPLMIAAILYTVSSVVHFIRVGKNTAELVPAGLALCAAVFYWLLSSWLDKAAASFSRVAHTNGYDITHLMNALRHLRRTFGLLAVLVQIYILLVLVFLIVMVVGLVTRG